MVSSAPTPTPGGSQASAFADDDWKAPQGANDLRLIIQSNEVLHATPPSSPMPQEGGRDFVLIGGAAAGRHSGGGAGGQREQQGKDEKGAPSVNTELMEKVDFMGPSDSMKALFRLPYTREPVSIALHRVGETLVVDGALHELYDAEPPGAAAATSYSTASQQPQHQQPPLAGTSSSPSKQDVLTLAPASFRLPAGPLHLPPPPRDHPHFVNFRLRELSLLMGSDVRVFRNAQHPGGVSALFYEEDHGLELSHCLDSYLENVFAAIPELALTMTKRGYIRRCDLVRTDEIPLLQLGPGGPCLPSHSHSHPGGADHPPTTPTAAAASCPPASPADGAAAGDEPPGPPPSSSSASSASASSRRPLFDPKMLDLNATTLLRFLKENCRAEGSTYLLHREEGGKTVSLYDVTALSEKRQKRWKWLLAMLSYRFAMRIYQQALLFGRRRRQQLQMRHRRLLQTCMLLLQELSASGGGATAGFASAGGGQHESLCAAVQEQLADSYLGAAPKSVTHDETTTPSFPLPPPATAPPPVLPAPQQQQQQQQKGEGRKGELSSQQQPQSAARVNVGDLHKAEQHLSHGISLLVPLLKSREEEDGGDEDGEDETPIAFGAFSSSGAASQAAQQQEQQEEEDPSGGAAAALMVMEQMLGLRRKLVGTLQQLIDVHARRRDLPRVLETTRRAMHQIAEAAALAGLDNEQRGATQQRGRRRRRRGPWQEEEGTGVSEEEREVKARVRQWATEAARDLWSVAAELARGLALRPRDWTAGGELGEQMAATTLQEQGIELLAEMDDVLRRIMTGSSNTAPAAAPPSPLPTGGRRGKRHQPQPQQSTAAAAALAAEEVRRALANAPLRGLALVYLQPPAAAAPDRGKTEAPASTAAPAPLLLVPGDPVQGLLLDAGAGDNGREARLLLVAAALAQARVVGETGEDQNCKQQEGRLQSLRRLADACNEVGGSLRATLVALSSGQDVPSSTTPAPFLLPRARGLGTHAARGWFQAALALFGACARAGGGAATADRVNIALVHLNLAGVAKVAAACAALVPDSAAEEREKSKEEWLLEGLAQGRLAHEALGDREGDPGTWRLVSEEAAMLHLMLGLARKQALLGGGSDGGAFRLTGGGKAAPTAAEEAGVVGPLETSLLLYTQLLPEGGSRVAGQVAAVRYNLGAFHAQTWVGSRDRRQARVKLGAALTHYNHAFAHYYHECTTTVAAPVAAASTLLRIILDLSQLYLSVDAAAGAAGGGDPTCLTQTLECLLKAGPALRLLGAGGGEKVEEQLGRTLLRLAKVARGPEAQEKAKGMYRRLLLGRKGGGTVVGLLEELKAVYDGGKGKGEDHEREQVDR